MSTLVNRLRNGEDGMTTAEYAVGTVAACGFGGVLYQLLTSDSVQQLLSGLVEKAFGVIGG
ncbi:uncharacterized protein DUF4244 [Haloactinopolyspora alba]|uniref:Uncharacterized protein DUF4244 n=2 Tax=Haloactinopolyspora alba TaxID=648780 RepID=A0A2P8E7L6_9ACTN|nr:DUF4244 domain-containing protein [Haloactinopolyspora alba]PSL05418.1 uncharacterized protein DUF4244 [Haloactinopolyspora alba]